MKWYHGVFGIANSPVPFTQKHHQHAPPSETGWPWPERQDGNCPLDLFSLCLSPAQMFQKKKVASQNAEERWSAPHRSHLNYWQWLTQAVSHVTSYVFTASFKIKQFRVYMAEISGFFLLFWHQGSPRGPRRMLWCLGHQHSVELAPDSKPSVGGDVGRAVSVCIHAGLWDRKSSLQTFVLSQFPGDDAMGEWSCNCSALWVLDANSSMITALPAAAASLHVGKLALRCLNGSRPGLKACRLDYTRHLIFQLEKCFSLALLMKINWRHMLTRPRGRLCKHSVRRSRLTHTKKSCA